MLWKPSTKVPLPAGQVIEDLWQLEDADWGPLLEGLEGDELHSLLTRLRRAFLDMRRRRERYFSPITQISHRAFFDFASGWLVIEMLLSKNEEVVGGQA